MHATYDLENSIGPTFPWKEGVSDAILEMEDVSDAILEMEGVSATNAIGF